MRHGSELREEAVALFDAGFGERSAAHRLGLSVRTVRKWLYTYRAVGKEALLVGKHKHYPYETKLAAARDVVAAFMDFIRKTYTGDNPDDIDPVLSY